jgi:hypothetical protein
MERNLAGQLGFIAPKEPPACLPALGSMGGFVLTPRPVCLPPRLRRGVMDAPGDRNRRTVGEALAAPPGAPHAAWLPAVAAQVLAHLGLAPQRPARRAAADDWLTALRDVTRANGRLHDSLRGFVCAANYDRAGLTPAGAAALLHGLAQQPWTAVRLLPRLRRLHPVTLRRLAPTLAAVAMPAVSWLVPAAWPLAARGEFSAGLVVAFVSVPHATALRAVDAQARAPELFAVVRMLQHEVAAEAALLGRVPAMRGVMEPWRVLPEAAPGAFALVPVGDLIRQEHVQPRFTAGGAPGYISMWRWPGGGAEGAVPDLPMPEGVDGEESDAESDRESEGGEEGVGGDGDADSDEGGGAMPADEEEAAGAPPEAEEDSEADSDDDV